MLDVNHRVLFSLDDHITLGLNIHRKLSGGGQNLFGLFRWRKTPKIFSNGLLPIFWIDPQNTVPMGIETPLPSPWGPFHKRFHAGVDTPPPPKFDGVDKFQFHNLNFTHATPKTGVDPAQIYPPKNVAQIHPRHQLLFWFAENLDHLQHSRQWDFLLWNWIKQSFHAWRGHASRQAWSVIPPALTRRRETFYEMDPRQLNCIVWERDLPFIISKYTKYN